MYCIDQGGDVVVKSKEQKTFVQQSKNEKSVKDDTMIRQVSTFSKQVVEKMSQAGIPATPENFAIYFDKLLEEKPLKQRQAIQKVLETETLEENIYVAHVENDVKESFRQIKVILETVSGMYTKINKLKTLTKHKIQELSNGSGQIALVAYEEQLEEIVQSLELQQKTIKEHYGTIAEKIKTFHANSIFDPKYDVYNKNFLFKTIESEKKNVSAFGYESSLVAFKIKQRTLESIKLQKDKELVIKNIAAMILKRSRRSDIVAHLGNNIFVILLRHTTLSQAEKAIESIDYLIQNTNYIVDSQQIEIELEYGRGKIAPHQTKDQILSALINQLS